MKSMLLSILALGALAAASPAGADDASPDTLDRIVPIPGVEVSTARPGANAPIARTTLGRDDIARRHWGQDTPMALATLPGAYAYSDAGNGIGYSYLSIRGFPQRRVSVLINGVPLNDPESHEVYWIDHPDLLASASEVEVQRGVGSALYGAASLGGSVNIETSPFGDRPRTSATVAYGSYETKRLTIEGDSGPLADGWNLYGRYSRIESFGYRDQSWSKLWSYALAARRTFSGNTLRLSLYGGPEETHLSYLGVQRAVLDGGLTGDADRDRRFNPISYPNERDHFFEPHYELIHSWTASPSVSFTQTLFYFEGRGYYDERRLARGLSDYRLAPWATWDPALFGADSLTYYRDTDGNGTLDRDAQGRVTLERFDVVRRRTVENRHYGWVPRVRAGLFGGTFTFGGEIRAHDGRHFGEVVSGAGLPPGTTPNHTYYDYHPRTLSAGLFARHEWQATDRLLVTSDLGWRHQGYAMRGDHFDGIRFDQDYDFALPRVGVTWTPRADLIAFASWSQARREPAFRDLYDAEGVGSVPLYRRVDVAAGIYDDPLIRPERVNDYEAGARWRLAGDGPGGARASAGVNLFRMDFRDELVYAGQFNTDLGYPILGNAARSVHQGVELAALAEGALGASGVRGTLEGNATLCDNYFKKYSEIYGTTPADVVSYDGKALGFFPAVLGNLAGRMSWRGATLGAEVQHAGRIYVDNTESEAASIDPRTVVNLIGEWSFPWGGARAALRARVFNVFDESYETGGYMDYDAMGILVPHLIPAATRNALVELRIEM